MGIISAKCPDCWDREPCGCESGREREASWAALAQSQAEDRRQKEIREQNALLKRIAEALEKK
jgi:hypothetical protein